MTIALALLATLASACALNVGYLLEHQAVRGMPALSVRRPLRSLHRLLGTPRWLLGFTVESCGWVLFVIALALAPLSIVQATAAGGIGILALLSVRLTGTPLAAAEQLGVVISIAGLALLGISLAGGHAEGTGAAATTIAAWIAASGLAAAAALRLLPPFLTSGAAYGLATGLLFASGDIATKAAVEEGGHPAFIAALIGCYAAGTLVLQAGFQHGSPLATAGLATLLTNALPIVAGMTIFSEPLPAGWLGGVRIGSFAAVVIGGVFLAERKHGTGRGVMTERV
jgi:hypothetical protein